MLSIYKASAGSGKTYTLTHEYIRLLLADPNEQRAYRHILAVTFTKKATAEMKQRILAELNKAPEDSKERQALIHILQDYTHFAVSTIDGFFQMVVRQFVHELGLPALFNLSLDDEEIVEQAVDDLIFNDWIRDFTIDNILQGKRWNPKEDIKNIARYLLKEQVQQLLPVIEPKLTDLTFMRTFKSNLQDAVEAKDKTAIEILKHFNELGTIVAVAQQIERTNKEQNRLPIADINQLLLRVTQSSSTPFIYEKLGTAFHHFMIDEFQDTSKAQWANFRPLIEESNATGYDNMVVGDVKQSIYRFRNSDWKQLAVEVAKDFPDHKMPKMEKNYRSAIEVVETNNALFEQYLPWVAEHYSTAMGKKHPQPERVQQLLDSYNTVRQTVQSTEHGFVQFTFLPTETPAQAEQMALDQVPSIIDGARQRGVPFREIAILARASKDVQLISQYLIEKGYPIQTAEGLLLSKHPAITIIVCSLILQLNPQDTLTQARLQLALDKTGIAPTSIDDLTCLPLYDLIQAIIDTYHLEQVPNAIPYLTTFQDLVYDFISSHPAHIAAFLDYWQRREAKMQIPCPASEAIQVMTIHKAKGLEWDVVIIPFLNWSIGPSRMDSSKLLWCDTRTIADAQCPLTHELDLIPVQFTQKLLDTDFVDAYAEELMNLYMDNTNLTYVAFTRPKRELYAFGQAFVAEGKKKPSNIGQALSLIYPDGLTAGQPASYLEDLDSLENLDSLESLDPLEQQGSYQSVPLNHRLTLRTRNLTEPAILDIRDLGIVMHDWLAGIVTPADTPTAFEQMQRDGRIRPEDEADLQAQMERFLAFAQPYHWFDQHEQVLCERDILLSDGHTLRPDRVMVDGEVATIIDYKFGSEHKREYQEQVREYITLYNQMGYKAEGYIVYVNLQKVDKVL